MILNLLKRAVKIVLHDAVEEWAFETGLPQKVIQEMRAQRQAHAAQAETRADALAASNLNIEDEDEEALPAPVLLMPSAAQTTTPLRCPILSTDETDLLAWVHQQRQEEIPWAEIARAANENGHDVSEEALRTRYRRWREKNDQGESSSPIE